MNPHRLVWGFDGIPLAYIAAVATAVSWIFSSESKKVKLDATSWLIIALVLYVSFTTTIALNPEFAFDRWDRVIKVLGFTLATIALTTNRIRCHSLVWIMGLSIGFYGLKGGIFSLLSGGGYRIYGPPDSMIQDNNDIALALAVMLPMMNYLRMNSAVLYVRLGWLIVMGASLVAILGTYSRGGFLALAGVGIFIWVKSRQKLLSGIIISISLVSAIFLMPDKWTGRIETIGSYEEDASAVGRLEIWGAALKIAFARPLTGGGFGATYNQTVVNAYAPGVTARAPHSVFFEVIGEQGFVAFVIWAAIPILGWRNARWIERRSRERPDWKWANDLARMSQASLIGYFVGGAFANFAYWDCYFTLVALLVAARSIIERGSVTEPSAALQRTRTPKGSRRPEFAPKPGSFVKPLHR